MSKIKVFYEEDGRISGIKSKHKVLYLAYHEKTLYVAHVLGLNTIQNIETLSTIEVGPGLFLSVTNITTDVKNLLIYFYKTPRTEITYTDLISYIRDPKDCHHVWDHWVGLQLYWKKCIKCGKMERVE
jgi:hypothetical protein